MRPYIHSDYFFFSSLDGELSTTTATTTTSFAPRVENGSFLSYTLSNNIWTVFDKKGTRYSFGTTTASRIDNVASSSQVYKWYLEEVRDTNGNYIKYEYGKDNGQVYPSRITYTGNGVTDGIFTVNFATTTRSDTASSTASGFQVKSEHIINRVDVKTNGTLTRRYDLATTTGNNTDRLLLSSITESGYTEAGATTTLPATAISYQTATTSWALDTGYSIPVTFGKAKDTNSKGVVLDDVNGDGLLDLIKSWSDVDGLNPVQAVYINNGNGTGWTEDSNYTIPVTFIRGTYDRGVRVFDVNGDGLADIVKAQSDLNGTSTVKAVYINDGDGTGWTQDSNYDVPEVFTWDAADKGVRPFDVNGDGLIDLVRSWESMDHLTVIKGVYINDGDGTGWTEDTNYTIPVFFNTDQSDDGVRAFDVNGDGLVDFVQAWTNGSDVTIRKVYINKGDGTGWEEDANYTIPVDFNRFGYDLGVRPFDVNGDGLTDLVKSWTNGTDTTTKGVYINNGNGTGWTLDASTTVPITFQNDSTGDAVRIVDIDSDGRADLFRAWTNVSDSDTKEMYISDGDRSDLLNRTVSSHGAVITAKYKNSPRFLGGATTTNPRLPMVLSMVEAIGRYAGVGNVATTTYSYGGGRYYFNNSYDRRFAGFASTTATSSAGFVTKEYAHQGDGTNSSQGEYSDHISKAGKIYRTEEYDGSQNLYRKTITQWDRYSQGTDRDFVKQTKSVTFSYDGNADHRDKAETFVFNDANGNLTSKIEWGEVAGSDDGTFTDTASDKRTTSTTYATSSAYVIGLPSQETLANQSTTTVKDIKYYYDSLSSGTADKGNLTKQENWATSTTYASTTKAYNSYGLVSSERDPNYNVTSYDYDSFNLYPATSTNALSHVTGYLYDYSAGKVKQTLDPNSRVYQIVYDGLDRITEEKQPDLTTPTTLVVKNSYTYTVSTSTPTVIHKTSNLNSATSTDLYTYLDGFGRTLQTRKSTETTNTYSTIDRSYNSLGLLERESLPYFATSTTYTSGYSSGLQSVDGIAASSTLSSSLVSYWKFDESSGNANDATATNNDLTNNNTTPFVAAKLNNGADFEADNQQSFSIADASQTGLGFTGDFSISVWFKHESLVEGPFVSKHNASGANRSYAFAYNGGTSVYLCIPDGAGNCSGGTFTYTPSTGVWTHYVMTYTVSTGLAQLWINGVSQGTSNTNRTSINVGNSSVSLGGSSVMGWQDGVFDEVALFSRALSQGDVNGLYNGGSGLAYSTTSTTTTSTRHLYTRYEYDALDRKSVV